MDPVDSCVDGIEEETRANTLDLQGKVYKLFKTSNASLMHDCTAFSFSSRLTILQEHFLKQPLSKCTCIPESSSLSGLFSFSN